MDFVDRELQCVECLATFTFSASEQQFFRDKGFENDPKRCKVCKAQHKKGIRKAVETRVKCSECGIDTTVPFKLVQNRAALCRTCFRKATISEVEHANIA
jgi:CxxC-x17-CxxC domain-containing protein